MKNPIFYVDGAGYCKIGNFWGFSVLSLSKYGVVIGCIDKNETFTGLLGFEIDRVALIVYFLFIPIPIYNH